MRISMNPDWEVCDEAATEDEALALVNELRPDLITVDISLKDGNGIELIKQVKSRYPSVKMLVISGFQESLYAELDLTDAEIAQHVLGCDAVLSCLGHNITVKGIYGHPRQLVTLARKLTGRISRRIFFTRCHSSGCACRTRTGSVANSVEIIMSSANVISVQKRKSDFNPYFMIAAPIALGRGGERSVTPVPEPTSPLLLLSAAAWALRRRHVVW